MDIGQPPKDAAATRAAPAPTRLGPWVQVSRLGHPLINEVIIPLGQKDYWNAATPKDDAAFLKYVQHPELAALHPVLYSKVFPNLCRANQPVPYGFAPGTCRAIRETAGACTAAGFGG